MRLRTSSLRLWTALRALIDARDYTQSILETIDPDDWFRMPAEGVTHVAWQVGHLAMAEYRLALERMRGTRPEDDELISPAFLAMFGKGSIPSPDPQQYPAIEEIRLVFDRIHAQMLIELEACPDADLDLPPHKPHVLFRDRLGSLLWCARHESLHAGQICLLRRLLGSPPRW